jgi:hypothetical protein
MTMAILSMGTALTDDVESGLHLTEIVDPLTQDGAMITLVVKAAESQVKLETGRNFELFVFLAQEYDIAPNTTDLLLSDRPVVTVDEINEVIARNSDGSIVKRKLEPNEYVVDKATGIVSKLSGSFLAGKQALVIQWTSGYPADAIQNSATSEIKVLKQLCLSITQNWHNKRRHGAGPYTTLSAPGESASFNFDYTLDEQRMINLLRKG